MPADEANEIPTALRLTLAATSNTPVAAPSPRFDAAPLETLRPRVPKYAPMLPLPALDVVAPHWDDSAYISRQRLTLPPSAVRGIEIPYPQSAARNERVAVRLSLFIREDGSVAEARVETPYVPQAFADAARKAFLAATFRPGEVDGVRVKSRILIEASFEPDVNSSPQ
jgi:hypothetical protein